MNKAFEKIIEKLEEEKMSYFLTIANTGDEKLDCAYEHTGDALDKAIDIVKQEAGQYNNAIIDGKYCFQSCACTEKCDKCSRLCNGDIDWYENIDNWTEEYNNGWIPCSERFPEEYVPVNVTWINRNPESYYAKIKDVPFSATAVYYNSKWYWYSSTCVDYLIEYGENDFDLVDKGIDIVAWQPLPEPYQPKGE